MLANFVTTYSMDLAHIILKMEQNGQVSLLKGSKKDLAILNHLQAKFKRFFTNKEKKLKIIFQKTNTSNRNINNQKRFLNKFQLNRKKNLKLNPCSFSQRKISF